MSATKILWGQILVVALIIGLIQLFTGRRVV